MKLIFILCLCSLSLFASIEAMASALLKAKITQQEIMDGTYITDLETQDTAESLTTLALIYIEGRIEDQDNKKALNYLFRASEKGSSKANYFLGLLYEEGKSVEQNFDLAEMFYKKASLQGNAEASYALAVLYHFGTNGDLETKVDKKKALLYYHRAYSQGKKTPFIVNSIDELTLYSLAHE